PDDRHHAPEPVVEPTERREDAGRVQLEVSRHARRRGPDGRRCRRGETLDIVEGLGGGNGRSTRPAPEGEGGDERGDQTGDGDAGRDESASHVVVDARVREALAA